MAEAEERAAGEDRISELSDDLLREILWFLPTRDAVATMFLSKRWGCVWTELPSLDYIDKTENNSEGKSKSVWWFLDGSMRFHNATLIEELITKLGPQCPIDADVAKWLSKAIDSCVRTLKFTLNWNSEPIIMPKSLYTSKTLTKLVLSDKILVNVPCEVYLPSLYQLRLSSVVYKDQDSHARLLSSCPVLKDLYVCRADDVDDNVRQFTMKVPCLLRLTYLGTFLRKDDDGSFVIDTPDLTRLEIIDGLGHSSIKHMPRLKRASFIGALNPADNFLTSLSSIVYLELSLRRNTMVPWCNVVYSLLVECSISLYDPDFSESLCFCSLIVRN